jgi:hypoxanthine-guanine phosphoribosyltransferase
MNVPPKLNQVARNSDVSLYELLSDTGLEIFLASTPNMRYLLTSPESCGITFQKQMSKAIKDVMTVIYQLEDRPISKILSYSPIDILYILRGGLNFNLHINLSEVTGSFAEVSFLSSQRLDSEEGFKIGESSYQKWSIQDSSLLCVGDICATGTTLKHTLDSALARYAIEEKKPRWLLVVTIGTSQLIQELVKYKEDLARVEPPHFEGLTVVFLEGIFHLYVRETFLSNTHLPFTDFFRKSTPCTFQFEDVSLSNPICFLERCAIYDGGSRAFEPKLYLNNLCRYWNTLRNQSSNLDLIKLLELKSNLMDYRFSFDQWLGTKPWWERMDTQELQHLHQKGRDAVDYLLSKSLATLCEERLQVLPKVEN